MRLIGELWDQLIDQTSKEWPKIPGACSKLLEETQIREKDHDESCNGGRCDGEKYYDLELAFHMLRDFIGTLDGHQDIC